MFHNQSDEAKEVVVMPDGRIDLFFLQSASEPFHVTVIGLETSPEQRSIPPQTLTFVISFKPLAVEYILHTSIADLLNSAKDFPNDFWNFSADDLKDFDAFYKKASQKIKELLPAAIDERKHKLFALIYSSNGETSVKEFPEKVFWTGRQINRYFNQQFRLSLKAYCNILRFRASLEHIAQGKLFPELNFTDQTHFVKEIKKISGVVPKELSKNKNDRFVLLSVFRQKQFCNVKRNFLGADYSYICCMKKPHSLPVTFILDYDKESGYYASQIKEYPHVISQGKTKEEAIDNVIDAFMEFVEMYKQKPVGRVRSSRTRIVLPSNLLIYA